MSVQDKDVGFELNETDFPELSGKLTGRKEKGRRSAVADRHARQAAKAGAFLVKTIDDPNHVLGKKRKERVASECHDGIASNVVYSMNKNKRWEALDDEQQSTWETKNTVMPVQLVERVLTAKDTVDNVVSLKEVNKDGDLVRFETAGGTGTNLHTLLTTGASKKGHASEAEVEESTLDENGEPKVLYTIYKPHKNHKVLTAKLFNRKYNIRKAGKVRKHLKRVDLDEMSTSIDEMKQSIHIDDGTVYKPSRDFKFCLGDYITPESTATKPVFVRRQSIESVQPSEATYDELEDREKLQSLNVVDISQVIKAPQTFEWAFIDISTWNDLEQQVEELKEDKRVYIQWLDADLSRLSIDASRLALGEKQPHGASILMIVAERVLLNKKQHLKVLLNSSVAPSGPFSWQILRELLKHSHNLNGIVSILSKLVSEWRESLAPEGASSNKAQKSRIELKRDLFQPAFNSSMLARPAQVMSAERMAEILREDSTNTEEPEERFERIDFETEDFDFEDSDDDQVSVSEKLKCVTCDCTKNAELFELDDCWQCRDCLCKHIVNQIRSKCIPLNIPFVLGKGQSAYDILPAIIPLPLLKFYTKLAASESLANDDGGDIGECPSCKQLVHIDKNSFNTSSCYSCGIHWCPSCDREPHFPMTCTAYASWIEKWEREFELHVLEKTDFLKRIKCACGFFMEVPEHDSRAECGGCGRVFSPKSMKMLEFVYRAHDASGAPIHCLETSEVLPAESVELVPASKLIKREFSEVCGEARKLRFSTSKKVEFEKAIRKLKNTHAGVEKLRDIRKTVGMLVIKKVCKKMI
uniref:IBR domain-containing protein n=1 Tax=Caenorhabditis japonica TaxID=281687 RepID=A0A8R1DJM5_CAEJA